MRWSRSHSKHNSSDWLQLTPSLHHVAISFGVGVLLIASLSCFSSKNTNQGHPGESDSNIEPDAEQVDGYDSDVSEDAGDSSVDEGTDNEKDSPFCSDAIGTSEKDRYDRESADARVYNKLCVCAEIDKWNESEGPVRLRWKAGFVDMSERAINQNFVIWNNQLYTWFGYQFYRRDLGTGVLLDWAWLFGVDGNIRPEGIALGPNGALYIESLGIFAFDPFCLERTWRTELFNSNELPGFDHDGNLYIAGSGDASYLYKIDPIAGQFIWHTQALTTWAKSGRVVLSTGKSGMSVATISGSREIAGVSSDGTLLWDIDFNLNNVAGSIYPAVSSDGRFIYTGIDNQNGDDNQEAVVISVDPETGENEVLYKLQFQANSFDGWFDITSATTTKSDELLFSVSWTEDIYSEQWQRYVIMLEPDGSERWRIPWQGNDTRPCVYQKQLIPAIREPPIEGPSGRIYLGAINGQVIALSRDGERIWRYDTCAPVYQRLQIDAYERIYAIAYILEETIDGRFGSGYLLAFENTDL